MTTHAAEIQIARPALAPDGLPWPEGYFERAPRISIEDAIKAHGVRPSRYWHGFPVYTAKDCQDPNYIFPYPPETDWVNEVERQIRDESARDA